LVLRKPVTLLASTTVADDQRSVIDLHIAGLRIASLVPEPDDATRVVPSVSAVLLGVSSLTFRSIDLGIAGAELRRIEPGNVSKLGALMTDIGLEEDGAEPALNGFAAFHEVERLGERMR